MYADPFLFFTLILSFSARLLYVTIVMMMVLMQVCLKNSHKVTYLVMQYYR